MGSGEKMKTKALQKKRNENEMKNPFFDFNHMFLFFLMIKRFVDTYVL